MVPQPPTGSAPRARIVRPGSRSWPPRCAQRSGWDGTHRPRPADHETCGPPWSSHYLATWIRGYRLSRPWLVPKNSCKNVSGQSNIPNQPLTGRSNTFHIYGHIKGCLLSPWIWTHEPYYMAAHDSWWTSQWTNWVLDHHMSHVFL